MKLLHLTSFLFVFAISILSCKKKVNTVPDLQVRLDSLFQSFPDFSGVVLIAEKETVVYHKAFGFKDFEAQIKLDTADIFELASLSKQFTAMVIMMLQAQGRLNYDDSVSSFIPNLPYKGITLRHLLTHTSGLPDYQSVMDQHWDKSKVAGNKENIEYLIRYQPEVSFKPGEQYEYSNTGYMLLASIAEIASGEDFITLCQTLIFDPIGMASTGIRTKEEKSKIENFARGHIYVSEKQRYVSADSFPEFNYAIWLGNRKGPGRVSSTARDLFKWDQALYTERLVKESTLENAFSPMKLTTDSISYYGFGWDLGTDKELGEVVSHTGDNPGYQTEIIRFIDTRKTIILLNNNAHQKKSEIITFLRKALKEQ